MSRFYDLPKLVQWIIAIVLMVGGLGFILPIMKLSYGLLLLPIVAPLINLVSVPFLRLVGVYKYLNPYVLSSVQNDKKYDLHNIFTFDYLVNFKWADRGRKVQRTLLVHYFKALLTIVERIEGNQLSPEVEIIGHSYFFSNRTAEKLGFAVSNAGFFWVFNSAVQFIELTYLYSFSQGKWAIPKFWKVKRAKIIGSDLVKKKEVLERLVEKLQIFGLQ